MIEKTTVTKYQTVGKDKFLNTYEICFNTLNWESMTNLIKSIKQEV